MGGRDAVSGGIENADGNLFLEVVSSYPTDGGNTWLIVVYNDGIAPAFVRFWMLCVTVDVPVAFS